MCRQVGLNLHGSKHHGSLVIASPTATDAISNEAAAAGLTSCRPPEPSHLSTAFSLHTHGPLAPTHCSSGIKPPTPLSTQIPCFSSCEEPASTVHLQSLNLQHHAHQPCACAPHHHHPFTGQPPPQHHQRQQHPSNHVPPDRSPPCCEIQHASTAPCTPAEPRAVSPTGTWFPPSQQRPTHPPTLPFSSQPPRQYSTAPRAAVLSKHQRNPSRYFTFTLLLSLLLHPSYSTLTFAAAVAAAVAAPNSVPSVRPVSSASSSNKACCHSLLSCPAGTNCLAGRLPTRRANNCRVTFTSPPPSPPPPSPGLAQQQRLSAATGMLDLGGSSFGPGQGSSQQQSLARNYIPVIGVPLVSDSPLYLLRWFYSIDFPVHHIVVVSGGENVFVAAETAHIADQGQNITLITCDEFLAVTEGWNEILSVYSDSAPWALITAYDVQLMPDYEYEHRIYRVLAPPANTTTYPDVFALHGNKATGQSSYTSGTTKIAEKLLQTRMSRGRELNPEYLAKKWGCKRPRRKGDGWKEVDYKTCRFLVPFNMTGSEIWTWEVDLSRRARLYGVFGYFSGLWGGDRRPSRVVLGNPFTQSYKGVVPGVAGW